MTIQLIAYSSSNREEGEFPDVEFLKREFRTSGVSFTGIGDSCVVRMEVENVSANLMLPSGLITSFKPQMWHGATMELLHTFVSQAEEAVQGGLSLALALHNDTTGLSWSPDAWALSKVSRTPESIQVELISTSEDATCQVKHVITLERDRLNSDILVSNSATSSSLHLMGSAMCHLTVSTPDAVYALGLEASDYFISPPFETSFSIIPPDVQNPTTFWPFNKLISKEKEEEEELMGEEDDNYKHLSEKLSRIYTSAPRSLTIIDRGRRNSVTVRRQGFKEVYIFSPGSEHEWYNNYSFICIANSALLEPVILNAQTEWRGGLQLWNPNS
ncbi:hypothetical protein ACS0TY_022498 [Phlomoides rotata]